MFEKISYICITIEEKILFFKKYFDFSLHFWHHVYISSIQLVIIVFQRLCCSMNVRWYTISTSHDPVSTYLIYARTRHSSARVHYRIRILADALVKTQSMTHIAALGGRIENLKQKSRTCAIHDNVVL